MRMIAGSVKPFVLAMVLVTGLLAACIPSPVRIIDRAIDRAVDRTIDRIAERVVSAIVDRLFERLFTGIFADAFGAVSVRYGPGFELDMATGSYDLTIAGAAPVIGSFRGAPLPEGSDPDEHNLSFGLRGVDEDGAEVVLVSLYQVEDAGNEFAIVLFEAEDSAAGEGGSYATIVFDGNNDEAFEGAMTWTITAETPTRLAGNFRAAGLTNGSGAGPIDVAGTFDVPINFPGSLILVRR